MGFGVPAVDRGLGPVPKGASILLRHDPAVDALPFLLQAAAHHSGAGRDVVFVVTSHRPSSILRGISDVDGPSDGERVFVVDGYSPLMGEREDVSYVPHPPTPSTLVSSMEQAVGEHPGCVLLIESLSSFIDRSDPGTFQALLPRVLNLAPATFLLAAIFTAWPYGTDTTKSLQRFNASIHLRGVEERVVLHQSLAVERTPWAAHVPPPTLYKIDEPGGVLAYVPKVLVLGPHGAGKTTFVHAVSDNAVSVERMGTTVAMDRGTATLAGVRAEVFGTPGQERFDPLLPSLAGQAVAVILLVDATKPETFERAKQMLQKVWRRGLVVTVALNKSDLKEALTPTAARKVLATPKDVDIVTCTSTDKASAQKVLSLLIDRVLAGGGT